MKSLPATRADRPLSDQLAAPCRSAGADGDAPKPAIRILADYGQIEPFAPIRYKWRYWALATLRGLQRRCGSAGTFVSSAAPIIHDSAFSAPGHASITVRRVPQGSRCCASPG